MVYVTFIISLFAAISVSFLLVVISVCASNKLGDSKGKFKDFSRYPMNYIEKIDNYNKHKYIQNAAYTDGIYSGFRKFRKK